MSVSIAKPPWSGLGKRLESCIRKALFDFTMLENNSIAVALSGGKAISGRGFPKLDIHAVHVHGAYSCGASVSIDYLQAICQQIDVSLSVCESTQKLETLECYRCSRERRRLLFEAAKKMGATTIAFGHHKDDKAKNKSLL